MVHKSKKSSSDNNIYPINTFKYDENDSFKYFRSFITFYNWITLNSLNDDNQIRKEFKKYYKSEKYFSIYYDLFHRRQDMVIFTYYNQIPSIFSVFPKEYYYYYPIITFYNNHMKKYYQNSELNVFCPYNKRLLNNDMLKFARNEVRVTIPIHMISDYKLPDKYACFILHNGNCYITNEIEKNQEYVRLKKYNIKNKHTYNYKSNDGEVELKISDIKFMSVLREITLQNLLDSFEMDVMKKGSILYHNTKEKEVTHPKRFYSIYPKFNLKKFMFRKYDNDNGWNCYTSQLTKDIESLNLTIDTFYNNPIILRKSKYSYYDPSDEEYKTIKEDKLFRCVNNSEKISQRKDICNLNISLFRKDNDPDKFNSGKRILHMIMYKNMSYIDKFGVYYVDFLEKLGITSFIYNLGYVLKDGDQYHYGCEFAFVNSNISGEYSKTVGFEKNECNKIKYFPDKEIHVSRNVSKNRKRTKKRSHSK